MRATGAIGAVAGIVLIAAGLLILAFEAFHGLAAVLWPIFIVTPGLALLAASMTAAWRSRSRAMLGGVIASIGIILFVQGIFGYYRSWAYAWTLIPFFAGMALFVFGNNDGDEAAARAGLTTMQLSAVAFILLAVAFELLIFGGGITGARYAVPILMILGGGYLLFRRRRPRA